MSGHSHWSTIRRKKEANDAKKGAVFTKVAREIVIAAREGGGDPDSNMRLRMVLDKARSMGMPKDNIERAVKRGAGDDKDAAEIVEIMYEGYGPNGVAMLIDVMTDNRNRTVAALRHALSRQGGSMGDPGSVAWQFERRGVIGVPASVDFDKLFEIAVEAGAQDVAMGEGEDNHEVYTDSSDLHSVSNQIQEAGLPVVSIDLVMAPKNEMSLPVKDAVQILKLVDNLEEMDDVRRVFSNLEVTEEAVEAFESSF
ncbi:MAG: YebC/PmpR family DNA-binding transcriptional regulator [Anaerolineae bacterium]|jgi:YebC/PmpR family DNA-binding regulatory protein|nr:YebC/PmpR family DNA-binding transcriptional regulator [Anaerolineae bacterium]